MTNDLLNKLCQMKKRGFINEVEYKHCYPTGSQPARLYGLPKVHKSGVPLRPILSASGTFNFGIAQLLERKLSHLVEHPSHWRHIQICRRITLTRV